MSLLSQSPAVICQPKHNAHGRIFPESGLTEVVAAKQLHSIQATASSAMCCCFVEQTRRQVEPIWTTMHNQPTTFILFFSMLV